MNGIEITHEVWRNESKAGLKVAWVYFTPATVVITYYMQQSGEGAGHSVRHEDLGVEGARARSVVTDMLGDRGYELVLRNTFRI